MSCYLHDSGGKECRPSLQQAHATDRVAAGGAAPDAAGIAVGGTSGAAAGGAVGSAAGVAVGDAAGAAAGSVEEPNTLRQQACATDDGEFEKMMAKFDDLDRQEAAAAGRALAAGLLLLTAWSHFLVSLPGLTAWSHGLVSLPGLTAWATCCQTLANMRCLHHAYQQWLDKLEQLPLELICCKAFQQQCCQCWSG